MIDQALDEARRIDYPIAIAVGMRSSAFANLLDGRIDEAVATIGELTDELMRRGALSNLRLLADVTAATAFRCGHPSWERLAATARVLPITTLAAAHFELVPLPTTSAEPLPRHEVVALVRHIVAELRVGGAATGSTRPTTAVAASPASITQLGDVYEFTYLGRTVAVRSTKGVADIVKLIGRTATRCIVSISRVRRSTSRRPARRSTRRHAATTSSGSATSRAISTRPKPTRTTSVRTVTRTSSTS